jgi:predicted membrane channel-forming protein YqfA (hemolysin III family)
VSFSQHVVYIVLEVGLYLGGTIFFVTRFPECSFPGRVDIWVGAADQLPSHTIFHLFIVGGALMHYFGLMKVYHSRVSTACPARF